MKLSEQEFQDIRVLIQKLCGIWLGEDKRYLVKTRLEAVVKGNHFATYAQLIQQASIASNFRYHDAIVEAITTKETSFNRDGHPFETFRDFLLPDLIANRISRQRAAGLPFGKLRLWSSAASTGQEAYSLAMVISDFLQTQPTITSKANPLKFENFSILGTDISAQAIEYASKGIYSVRELERGLTVDQKRKYFLESHGNFTVHSQIKGMVEFKRMDLTKPFVDANSVDFILCRNLLIYFDERTRKRVIDEFVKCLPSGGLLMLGAAESLPSLPQGLLQEQFGKTTVYRKVH